MLTKDRTEGLEWAINEAGGVGQGSAHKELKLLQLQVPEGQLVRLVKMTRTREGVAECLQEDGGA